jgi:hypothetical protein
MKNHERLEAQRTSHSAKLLATAGSLSSLYLLPFAADASLVICNGTANPGSCGSSAHMNYGMVGGRAGWDIDGNGTVDFNLFHNGPTANANGLKLMLTNDPTRVPINPFADWNALVSPVSFVTAQDPAPGQTRWLGGIAPLASNAVVGSGDHFNLTNVSPIYRSVLLKAAVGSTPAPVPDGFQAGTNYFGFKFYKDVDNDGVLSPGVDMILYGRAVMDITINGSGSGSGVTISSWQYDTVGQVVSAVPEPSTASLALIGLGAGGIRMWRARKNARA